MAIYPTFPRKHIHATRSVLEKKPSSRVSKYRDSLELSESGEIDAPAAECSSLYYPRRSLCATPIRHDYRHLYSGINRARPPRRRRSAKCHWRKEHWGRARPVRWAGFSGRSESTKIDEARGCRLGWTYANNVAPRKNLYDEKER